jgi:hypothetical protein
MRVAYVCTEGERNLNTARKVAVKQTSCGLIHHFALGGSEVQRIQRFSESSESSESRKAGTSNGAEFVEWRELIEWRRNQASA